MKIQINPCRILLNACFPLNVDATQTILLENLGAKFEYLVFDKSYYLHLL